MGRKLLCQNDLIEAIKFHNSTELKVFYNLLYFYKEQQLYREPNYVVEEVEIDIYKLSNYLGKKNLTKNELKEIIVSIPKGIYSKDQLSYISVFEYIYCEGVFIYYKVTESFRPYINDVIQNFTVLELKNMAELSSVYSIRMFEFISKNKNLGIYLMPINDFRDYFQVPDSYQISVITERILEYGTNEINSKTQFNVKYEKVKTRGKVSHIRFIMKENKEGIDELQ